MPSGLFEIVRTAKAEVELLIVPAHWEPNWGYSPPAEHMSFARALIDAGCDVVFGHSSHVFRGIEFYRGRPIIYCEQEEWLYDTSGAERKGFFFCETQSTPGEAP